MSGTKILSNQIKCNKCGDTPFSSHVHDFAECKCGAVAADGGMAYLRRMGIVGTDYTDMSIVVKQEVFDACMEKLQWCDDNGRNNLGRVCHMFIALRDSGYIEQ